MDITDFLGNNIVLIGLLGVVIIFYFVVIVRRRMRSRFLHKKSKNVEE
jgi:hypothetical protein